MKTKGNLISLISVISILLVSMAMTGCGTLLYKPDESVIKSMSFQEAKNKAESLYAQIQRGGNLKVLRITWRFPAQDGKAIVTSMLCQ